MRHENILVICAHNDDMIIGCGGAIAKYAKEGKQVHNVIFSHGEGSHPWLKPEVVKDMRKRELKESNRILGGKSITIFGLIEGKFAAEVKEKGILDKLKSIIKQRKPSKILTHSTDDPHPDHRAVLSTVDKVLSDMSFKGDIYTFSVWNPIRMKKRDSPRLVIDTTDTFSTKLAALKAHKSQLLTKITLLWSIYTKDILNGIRTGHRFAEVFFKHEAPNRD